MNYRAARVALFLAFDPLKSLVARQHAAGPGKFIGAGMKREFTVSLYAFLVPGASKFDEDSISVVRQVGKVRNF